ncbi:MAG: chloride channel protein [Lachnospiraceae bacterium]|nr:chloride channel protein [Lachnospiraceae bacterium]
MKVKLPLFCAITGAVAGMVFWLFLFAISKGTYLLWDLVPEKIPAVSFYPLIICTLGGLVIGIFRKFSGDYPESMMTVFGKLKKDGTYPYRRLPVIFIAALLPLIFGSSVGPEAGMVGVIVALCCWAGDNMKFAKSHAEELSKIGAAVSLSVIFRSPMFGLFDIEDELTPDQQNNNSLTGSSKVILYCIATGAGFGIFWLFNHVFVKVSEGFPSFDAVTAGRTDYLLFIVYLLCGILLGIFFEGSEKLFEKAGAALPPVISELTAGAVLGAIACFLPVIRFSGEEQMGILITDYAKYAPLAMIGIAFLKVLVTTMCINLGLKGGHFFPLIFASVCLGYGISLLIFPGDPVHAAFVAAVVSAGTLGVSMKKPLAVSMLLLLCFPAQSLLWIVPSAALSAFVGKKMSKEPSR